MKAARAFAGKRYVVLGLARTGVSVVDYLWDSSASLVAWDDDEEARARVEGKARIADPMDIDLAEFEAVIVSPGVPLNSHPLADKARAAKVPLIGDIELFAQARPELPPHRVVGITGTNGKSTTTALIHHICRTAGVSSSMGGNIGNPILAERELSEAGVYVLELSSFQIDLTQSLDCEVAILLNVSPDHLERYESYDDYAMAKARLFTMQSPSHVAIISLGDEQSRKIAKGARGKTITFAPGSCMNQADWPTLQGPHNAQNAIAAMTAARELGIDQDAIDEGLRSFPGLAHRMERIGDRNGVIFINDSKATNPASAAPALGSYPAIHWIVGGRSKTRDLDLCAPHFGNVVAVYTIGEAGDMFAQLLAPKLPVSRCGTLREAVRIAAQNARPGEVVLLSPACASFDQYRDFEARGDDFRAAFGGLT